MVLTKPIDSDFIWWYYIHEACYRECGQYQILVFLADMCGIALFILLQIGGDLFEN